MKENSQEFLPPPKQERKRLIEEYMDALEEWQALNNQLVQFYKQKRIKSIADNLSIYRAADDLIKRRANKINAPLPDVLLSDLALKYIEMIKKENKK